MAHAGKGVEIGVFIPIGNNGWLISTTAPQYKPTFNLNRQIVAKAEAYGVDFALSMIKLRGFGGASEFWDYNLESFTLMAGLAAVTDRINLYASVGTLTIPPALTARMAVTIDSIAPGRFGINIVTGWQRAEYDQMGLWPGEEHYARRYDHASEYVQIMRDLWTTGRSDFAGDYFQMRDCRMRPLPQAPIKIICAGQSDRGMRFTAEYGDYNFFQGVGLNTPAGHEPSNRRLMAEVARTGRNVGACILFMVIADETDEAAMASSRKKALPERPINLNMGTLVGSYASIARMLSEAAAVPGTKGIMLCFDDFLVGIEQFGEFILPLMEVERSVKLYA